jgi:hypothetical protein
MQFKSWLVLHETLCRAYVYMLNKRQGGKGRGGGRYFYSIKGTVQCAFYDPARVRTYCSLCIRSPDSKGFFLERNDLWEFLMFHKLMCS